MLDPPALPFPGDSDMAALMRTTDWASTPLGPPHGWPTSLRTMVGVILENRFPMLLWWGRQLLHLYNDGYRQILGDKHPTALAAPGSEVWAEIWHIIGPQAEGVMAGGPATWNEHLLLPMNRKGFLEETYFTFSYSPIPDDTGARGGVLVTCQETTEQIQDERQLRTLRELAERSAEAKTAEQACDIAARILGGNDADALFVLIYLADGDGPGPRLVASAGFTGDAPRRVDPATWPFAEVERTGQAVLVEELGRHAEPFPGGRWGSPPDRAICVPLLRQDQRPYGFLVCGISPRRLLDQRYRGFFRLAADPIAAAIAGARALQEARARADALAAIDRAKTVFFSNISHEFRTPLTLLLGPLQDLVRDFDLEDEVRERLTLARRNGLRLLKLVGAMLDYSRIEAGRMTAAYEPTDLAERTADLASAFRAVCERAGLRLTIDCRPLGEPVYVDHDMWEKIVLNLVSNAFKFTLAGEIVVGLRRTDDRAVLTVRDTGVGIPALELPRVFERFHRVESVQGRTFEGTGIGLALVLELVKIHGGTIEVASEVGQGSTFTVTLPLGRVHLPADRVRTEGVERGPAHVEAFVEETHRWLPADTAAPPTTAARERILLADDNTDMRGYLCRLLGARWDVEAVSHGGEALAAIRRRLPDLVVTDVMMPVMDGFGLLAALRADPTTRALPVLMVSARAGEDARVEGLRAGASDYLVKPFSARELTARVDVLLLRARVRAVEAAQARRVARVFEQAPVAIALLRGPDHVYESINATYRELIGGRPVLGKPVVEALPELAGQELLERLDHAYSSGEPVVGRCVRVELRRPPDDRPRECFFDFVYQPLLDDAGAVEGVAMVGYEVSVQVLARREADEANRAKDEFLAMLGHELRNPLSPIVTALGIMRLRGEVESSRERSIIERQVQHLNRLVDDLLDVSRITRGKIELRRRRVELAAVMAVAIETASPLLEQHRHELRVVVPRDGLTIDVDPDRFAQVIANLLTNAAKYTAAGGEITVLGERVGDEIVVRVRDNGIGVEPEFLERIFDPFIQARQRSDRLSDGLGLGLMIVRNLVELHGGSVSAASAGRGCGAEFTIRLPSLDPAHQAGTGPHRLPSLTPIQGNLRVLLVDDNEDYAEILATGLELLGYQVQCQHDGPSALRVAEDFDPDVVILDIGLPVMDGYELSRRFAVHPRLRRAIRVAVTGYGQDRDRDRASAAGFHAHLVKPIDLDALHTTLREITRR